MIILLMKVAGQLGANLGGLLTVVDSVLSRGREILRRANKGAEENLRLLTVEKAGGYISWAECTLAPLK